MMRDVLSLAGLSRFFCLMADQTFFFGRMGLFQGGLRARSMTGGAGGIVGYIPVEDVAGNKRGVFA